MTGCHVTMYPAPRTHGEHTQNPVRSKPTACGQQPVDEHGHCAGHAEQRDRLMTPGPPSAEWSTILDRLDARGH